MLIKTKLIPAPLRSCLLDRKVQIQRLLDAEAFPFIQISAPAGAGKTSLCCQWIAQSQLCVAWYALDEEDNEPDLFYRYFLTSLARADEGLRKALNPIIENNPVFSGDDVIPLLVETLSELRRDIHVVLDDFHRITNARIHADLARLVGYMPARLHIVILSRFNLPPILDASTLKKERLVLSGADLKFTEKETEELFRQVIPLSLSTEQVRELNRRVEGWAAGLQLIGLSIRSQGGFQDLSNILNQAHEQVANYLIHDILRMQSAKIRNFVLTTALLDRFNPDLCAEVSGEADAVQLLDHLDHMNLFLIPLNDDGGAGDRWYRYHHMFSEVVRRQVAVARPDIVATTLRNAALWLAHHQHLEDALRTAFRSNDMTFTGDLMEDFIMGYVETFDLAPGLRWIAKLPEAELNRRPLLRLQQCGFHSLAMELSEIKDIVAQLEKDGGPDLSRYSGEKLAFCQDLITYFRCMLQIMYAGETSGLEDLRALRDSMRPQNPLFAGYIDTHIVSIKISRGELVAAESFIERLSQTVVPKPDQVLKKKVYHAHARALIARHRGRLHLAEETIVQVLDSFNRQGYDDIPMAFLLHRHLGHIYYHQNQLEKARKCAADAVKYCEYFGLFDEIMAGSELWLQLYAAEGETEQVEQCIRNIHVYAIKLAMPRIAACADACAARFAITQGNLEAAGIWSQRRALAPDEPFSLLHAAECLTQARLWIARGEYGDATQLLAVVRDRCAGRDLAELLLQIDILQSAVFQALNRHSDADEMLMRALAFSEMEGYVRLFVNDADLIEPVLNRIAKDGSGDLSRVHLDKIIAACRVDRDGPVVSFPAGTDDSQALTQREIEILHWISLGFRNKEIAKKNYIAVTTVKSHVSHILSKLNVKTRTQAVVKARRMNIINPG